MFRRLSELEEGTAEHQHVRDSLVESNMTLVRFAATRFRGRADQMEDTLQAGTIGLMKAVDRFDPDYGTEFVTFALPTITGEIKRFFRDTSWAVHVPRRLQELRITLARAAEALAAKLNHTPTVAELAAHLNLSEKEVIEGQVASHGYTASSIDAQIGEEDETQGTSWASWLGTEDPALEGVENHAALTLLLAGLTDRERMLVSMRFGAEMSQAAIGAELGISQMQVSRLLTRLTKRLREQLLTEASTCTRRVPLAE